MPNEAIFGGVLIPQNNSAEPKVHSEKNKYYVNQPITSYDANIYVCGAKWEEVSEK